LRLHSSPRYLHSFPTRRSSDLLRSGELASGAIAEIISGKDRQLALREFARASAEMYWGRLWINRLARAAVLSPRIGTLFVRAARSEEHTSELQSPYDLVCGLLL